MTSDEVIERVADWLNAFKADPFATGGDKASALLELVGTLAKSRPVEGDVERVVEVWKEETRLDLDEKRNSGLDEFAKGFNYGIREARDLIYRRLPSLLAALPPAGVEEWQPIESAPKDGTRILLATEIGTVIGSWGMGRYLGKTKGYEKAWGRGSSYGWHPTHWQPLPAPPTPTTEQGSTEPTNGER